MLSDKEIEVACKAFLAEYGDPSAEWWDYRKEVTAALEAAARVREEDNAEGGELVASIPLGKGNVIDGGGANISQPLYNKHITIRDREAHPAPQPSGPVGVKPLEWSSWYCLHLAYSGFGTYRIEDQGSNWKEDRYWLDHNGERIGKCPTLEAAKAAAQADYERRILSALTAGKPHPDDEAVDRFAAAMKAKLKWEREERGRHGWNDPEVCSEKYLARLLIEHLAKGNDGKLEQSAWRPIETAPKDGTWIIAHRPNKGVGYLDRVVVVRWENEVSAWVWPDKPFDIYDEDLSERVYADSWADQISLFEDNSFTHWLPLPTPPTAGGDDE